MKTLLFLGDSITDCDHNFEPENLGFGYVRMISEQLNTPDQNCQVLNYGYDGFTVPAVHHLWKRSCLSLKPDFITLLIGINDLSRIKNTGITVSVGLAQFRREYESLIEDILRITDCPLLLMEPFIFPHPAEYTFWEPELSIISNIIKEIAALRGLHFLPLWQMLSDAAKVSGFSALTTDGIHLTPYGHALVAKEWNRQQTIILQNKTSE